MLCSEVFARFQSGMTAFFCLYRLDLPICTPNVRVVDCRGGSPAEFASDRRHRRSGTNGFIRGFCIRLRSFSSVFSMYSCMFLPFSMHRLLLLIDICDELRFSTCLFAQAIARHRLPASAQCCGRRGVFLLGIVYHVHRLISPYLVVWLKKKLTRVGCLTLKYRLSAVSPTFSVSRVVWRCLLPQPPIGILLAVAISHGCPYTAH